MTGQTKRHASAVGGFLVLALAAYLIGATQRGALPASGICEGEQIEMRSYVLFHLYEPRDSLVRRLLRRFENPGDARYLAARARAAKKTPNGLPGPPEVFEELGYKFPPGCYVRAAGGHLIDIAHYPSMLGRIERISEFQPVRRGRP